MLGVVVTESMELEHEVVAGIEVTGSGVDCSISFNIGVVGDAIIGGVGGNNALERLNGVSDSTSSITRDCCCPDS